MEEEISDIIGDEDEYAPVVTFIPPTPKPNQPRRAKRQKSTDFKAQQLDDKRVKLGEYYAGIIDK